MGSSLPTLAIRVIESMAQGTLDGKDTKKILDLGPLDLRPTGERPGERQQFVLAIEITQPAGVKN